MMFSFWIVRFVMIWDGKREKGGVKRDITDNCKWVGE